MTVTPTDAGRRSSIGAAQAYWEVDEKKRIERKVTPRYSIVNRQLVLFEAQHQVLGAANVPYKTRAKTTTE
jgi:hypothetical protein